MKKIITIFLFAFLLTETHAVKLPLPDVYCNQVKLKKGKVTSYFLPLELEFRYTSKDPEVQYKIKHGRIVYEKVVPLRPDTTIHDSLHFDFTSNRVRTQALVKGDRVKILLLEVEAWKGDKMIGMDNEVKTILLKVTPAGDLVQEEYETINKSNLKVEVNGKELAGNTAYTSGMGQDWVLTYIDDKGRNIEIISWEITVFKGRKTIDLYRGYETNKGNIAGVSLEPGAFIALTAHTRHGRVFKVIKVS
ncbi:MAG: hypothetical protein K2X86_12725 [Cytophagaceae bacterium]|nr:hypothetical protein [Cytophagaceae bacterium]